MKLGLGPKEKPWEAGWHFTTSRSVEIFKIWEDAFGGRQRLVRVLPSQAGNAGVSEGVLGFRDAANRHPRMGELYRRYFDEWARTGGDVFAVFSSIGAYSNFGAWGLAEFDDSKPSEYPKLEATLRWAKEHGQSVVFDP